LAEACRAALWLRFDFMDESHQISQEIHSPEGSFWHGILHRREPDWSNAKYWFHRVGTHPIFPELARQAACILEAFNPDPRLRAVEGPFQDAIRDGGWDALAFIDLCQSSCQSGGGDLAMLCRLLQSAEWQSLFDYCYRAATSD
jgi:hypothetical protein